MDDVIDYESVTHVLQAENESLRLFIIKLQNRRDTFALPDINAMMDWIQDHSVLLIVVTSVAVALLSTIDIGLRIARQARSKTDA
jgi:hypothetical protein